MKLCMGCMNQMEDQVSVCPHCGFNERELKQEAYYLTPGTVVGGKYIIGRALSYAGYTVTYIGMDAENNRKVLVKEYLPNEFSTRPEGDKEVTIYSGDAKEQFEEGLTTFLNEANRIQQLGRPQGIMQVYDCVAENDTGYVISEYLEGQTLAQMLEGGKKFSPQEAKEFICEILEGLRRVHPLDVVHCDIAPETIVVTRTGEIKLLDFGATRYVTTANSKSLAIILKQGYAPEEQYRSQGVRGPWTDVYALGAVMYHMITGIVPIESVDRALVDELKAPSQLGVPMPKNMENALMNALNVYQKDRTPSAEVFYRELNSDEVKRIQVKKQKYETGRFPKWAKALVAGLLCVVVAGGVVVVGKMMRSGDKTESKMMGVVVPNLEGMNEQEANKCLADVVGVKLELEIEDEIFDKDAEKESKIWMQEPAEGTKVSGDEIVNVVMRNREKCPYEHILKFAEDVDSLAKNLGIDDKSKVIEKEGEEGENPNKMYGNLCSIELNNGKTLELADLKKDEKQVLEVSKIKYITYYHAFFLYEKTMKDYTGKNIREVKLDKCKKTNGKIKSIKKKGIPVGNNIYYSFEKDIGYIVCQRRIGKSYNSAKHGNIFDVVSEKIKYEDNADDMIKSLKKKGFKNVKDGGGKGAKVDIIKINDKKQCEFFTKDDIITVCRKEEVTKPSAEQAVQSNRGSAQVQNEPDGVVDPNE